MTERTRRHALLVSLIAVFALTVTAGNGGSTTLLHMDMDDLVIEADHIVLGTIVGKRSEWNVNYMQQRSLLYTVYTLEAEKTLKGEANGNIEFRVVGGEDESSFLMVPAAPHFEVGERVVLFLRSPIPDSVTDVIGMEQGRFTVVDDTVVENGMELDDFLSLISKKLPTERD
jgi:hypothetical protein